MRLKNTRDLTRPITPGRVIFKNSKELKLNPLYVSLKSFYLRVCSAIYRLRRPDPYRFPRALRLPDMSLKA